MDPKLLFWTGALPLFAAIVASAVAGWRAIRRKDLRRHRRWMNTAVVLVLAFLALYVGKVLAFGKEQLELWSAGERAVLWIHETFVLAMVVAGTMARILARKLDPDRRRAEAPTTVVAGRASGATRRRHRRAGRAAIVAAAFGLVTAFMVLVGMYLRAAG